MEAKKLKALINDAISMAEGVPEPYKQKCFEILLVTLLRKELAPVTLGPPPKPEEIAPKPSEFVVPLDVRAFFQQQEIPEEHLSKLFLMSGTEVRPKYKITITKMATAQIQLALLIALENALRGGKFGFSIETVRQKCIEHKRYYRKNFQSYFKKNSKLFKDLTEELVELSPDGKAELADVISEIVK